MASSSSTASSSFWRRYAAHRWAGVFEVSLPSLVAVHALTSLLSGVLSLCPQEIAPIIVDNQEGYISFIYLKQIKGGGCGFGGKGEDL
jgi:hypothetical protein